MKIDFSEYELFPFSLLSSKTSSGARKGALLRIQFDSDRVGYSDCHPWPELGDLPLSAQLNELREERLTPLTQRSLEHARVDAEARRVNQSLFVTNRLRKQPFHLKNHSLISNLLSLDETKIREKAQAGYSHLKIKVGISPHLEAVCLRKLEPCLSDFNLKVRLDFNSSLTERDFDSFLSDLGSCRRRINFIEDPVPFDGKVWKSLQEKWEIPLALDRTENMELEFVEPQAFSFLIHKPAIQDPHWIVSCSQKLKVPVVVTSYLDHPLGQMCAAWVATEVLPQAGAFAVEETCGVLSHSSYRPHAFSEEIQCEGPYLKLPLGTGFGFDRLLAGKNWRSLKDLEV